MSKVNSCDLCAHRETCKFKYLYLRAVNAVKRTIIYDAEIPGEVQPIQISNLDFITGVNLTCKYFDNDTLSGRF